MILFVHVHFAISNEAIIHKFAHCHTVCAVHRVLHLRQTQSLTSLVHRATRDPGVLQ